jgi:hypothetical protein
MDIGYLENVASISLLERHHPLVIEGMGQYDSRPADAVAETITAQLKRYWRAHPPSKPIALVVQGDPIAKHGISAITRKVADLLDIPRILIFLDPEIADYHWLNADRYRVIGEIPFSQLYNVLHAKKPDLLVALERQLRQALDEKNARRASIGKPGLADYFYDFARLQEVTKGACKQICGEITFAQTSSNIDQFSVTSFYETGLLLGLITHRERVPYQGLD